MLIIFFLLQKVSGEITYNGYGLDEFNPRKTSTYVSQYDLHTPEMTVRETLAFSARFQGVGSRAGKCSIYMLILILSYFLFFVIS